MEQTTASDEARIEKIAGTPCDKIEREHGSTHSYKHGNECNRCRSRVNPAEMIPLHDDNRTNTGTNVTDAVRVSTLPK